MGGSDFLSFGVLASLGMIGAVTAVAVNADVPQKAARGVFAEPKVVSAETVINIKADETSLDKKATTSSTPPSAAPDMGSSAATDSTAKSIPSSAAAKSTLTLAPSTVPILAAKSTASIASSTAPSTTAKLTAASTTAAPSTTAKTAPSTTAPSTTAPSMTAPSTTAPSMAVPSTTVPSMAAPSTTAPSMAAPSTTAPSTTAPRAASTAASTTASTTASTAASTTTSTTASTAASTTAKSTASTTASTTAPTADTLTAEHSTAAASTTAAPGTTAAPSTTANSTAPSTTTQSSTAASTTPASSTPASLTAENSAQMTADTTAVYTGKEKIDVSAIKAFRAELAKPQKAHSPISTPPNTRTLQEALALLTNALKNKPDKPNKPPQRGGSDQSCTQPEHFNTLFDVMIQVGIDVDKKVETLLELADLIIMNANAECFTTEEYKQLETRFVSSVLETIPEIHKKQQDDENRHAAEIAQNTEKVLATKKHEYKVIHGYELHNLNIIASVVTGLSNVIRDEAPLAFLVSSIVRLVTQSLPQDVLRIQKGHDNLSSRVLAAYEYVKPLVDDVEVYAANEQRAIIKSVEILSSCMQSDHLQQLMSISPYELSAIDSVGDLDVRRHFGYMFYFDIDPEMYPEILNKLRSIIAFDTKNRNSYATHENSKFLHVAHFVFLVNDGKIRQEDALHIQHTQFDKIVMLLALSQCLIPNETRQKMMQYLQDKASASILTYIKLNNTSTQNQINRRFQITFGDTDADADPITFKLDYAAETQNQQLKTDQKTTLKGEPLQYTNRYLVGPVTKIFKKELPPEAVAQKLGKIKDHLKAKRPVFIMGYGASGAGKTSTLIYRRQKAKGVQGVIPRLCADFCKETGSNVFITLKVYEVMKDGVYRPTGSSPLRFGMNKVQGEDALVLDNDFTTHIFHEDRVIKMNKAMNKAVEFIRDQTTLGEALEYLIDVDRYVKATPNNPQSSRSHVLAFISFFQPNDENNNDENIAGTLIVGDFAGVENSFECEKDAVVNAFNKNPFYSTYSVDDDVPDTIIKHTGGSHQSKAELEKRTGDFLSTSYLEKNIQNSNIFTEVGDVEADTRAKNLLSFLKTSLTVNQLCLYIMNAVGMSDLSGSFNSKWYEIHQKKLDAFLTLFDDPNTIWINAFDENPRSQYENFEKFCQQLAVGNNARIAYAMRSGQKLVDVDRNKSRDFIEFIKTHKPSETYSSIFRATDTETIPFGCKKDESGSKPPASKPPASKPPASKPPGRGKWSGGALPNYHDDWMRAHRYLQASNNIPNLYRNKDSVFGEAYENEYTIFKLSVQEHTYEYNNDKGSCVQRTTLLYYPDPEPVKKGTIRWKTVYSKYSNFAKVLGIDTDNMTTEHRNFAKTLFDKVNSISAGLTEFDTTIDEVKLLFGQVLMDIINRLEDSYFRRDIIIRACDSRRSEGYFINESLAKVRDEIDNLILDNLNADDNPRPVIVPALPEGCIKKLCAKHEGVCSDRSQYKKHISTAESFSRGTDRVRIFESDESLYASFESAGVGYDNIMQHLMKQELSDLYGKMIVCVFCVLNLTPNYNPVPTPYFDTSSLKFAMRRLLSINDIQNELSSLVKLVYKQNPSMLESILEFEGNVQTMEQQVIKSFVSACTVNYPQDVADLQRFIADVDRHNQASAVGTIEYVDKLSKMNVYDTMCSVKELLPSM